MEEENAMGRGWKCHLHPSLQRVTRAMQHETLMAGASPMRGRREEGGSGTPFRYKYEGVRHEEGEGDIREPGPDPWVF